MIAGIASHALKREREAKQLAEEAIEIAEGQLETAADAQSERQQLALNFRVREVLDLYLSLPAAEVSASEAYRRVLNWKGTIQARMIGARLRQQSERSATAAELEQVASRLSSLSLQVPDPVDRPGWLRNVVELRERKESLEAELAFQNGAGRSVRSLPRNRSEPQFRRVRRLLISWSTHLFRVGTTGRRPMSGAMRRSS